MKAAVVEALNQLVVRDIPEPVAGPYDAHVDILFGTICAGTDSHLIDGSLPFLSPVPTVLGHESIGRVTQVGPKVRSFKVGDLITRVGTMPGNGFTTSWGGFAEKGIARDHKAMSADGIDAAQWCGHKPTQVIPPDFDPAAACMIITWRETFSFISRAGVKPGQSVMVIGSGGNGLAFLSHAKNKGAKDILMIGSPDRREVSLRTGATDFVDYKNALAIEEAKGKYTAGFDLAIDAVGKTGQANVALSFLKPGGTLAVYGLDDIGKLSVNLSDARGTFTYFNGGYDEEEAHDAIVEFIKNGKLDASILIDLHNPYPLEKINEAFDAIKARTVIKPLIKIKGS
ncbi:MAG: zinc-binding dehydrogenase [Verrucomicrobiota bacterium]|nr:zinc-binding dehydrogenase [Verrucomicrobiota bacterium]